MTKAREHTDRAQTAYDTFVADNETLAETATWLTDGHVGPADADADGQ